MSLTTYGSDTINTPIITCNEDKDIFLKIGKTIHQRLGVSVLYEYQNKLTTLISNMTRITSKVNRLKMAEMNNVDYEYQFNGIKYFKSINEGKKLIKNELSFELDNFINYLKSYNDYHINYIIEELVMIFNNLKEEQIVRDYTKQLYSDAEKSLLFTKENLNEYIREIQESDNIPKAKMLNYNKDQDNKNNCNNFFIWLAGGIGVCITCLNCSCCFP